MSPYPAIPVARRALRPLLLSAVVVFAVLIMTASKPGIALAGSMTIYGDAVAAGWTNCSWDSSVNLSATGQTYKGTRAIEMTLTAPRGGLCLKAGQAVNSAGFSELRFAARASKSGQRFQVFLYDSAMQPTGYVWLANAGGDPPAGAWKTYTIPLTMLGAAGKQIGGIGIQSLDAITGQPLRVDEVILSAAPVATPKPTATPKPSASPTPTPRPTASPTPTPKPTVSPTVTPAPTPSATPRPSATPASSVPTLPNPSFSVYGDATAQGWTNCSWDVGVDFGSAGQVYSGSRAIALTVMRSGGGLCLFAGDALDTSAYTTLHFAARAGQSGQRYQVFIYGADGQPTGGWVSLSSQGGDPTTAGWTVYNIPLRMLGGDNRRIKGIGIQQTGGGSGTTLYLDEVAFTGAPSPSPVPSPSTAPSAPLALGAYIDGGPGDPAQIDAFASLTGRTPSIVMWYEGWGSTVHGEFNRADMDVVTARGAAPMITWMPWDHEQGPEQPLFTLTSIAGGAHDAYVQRWAEAAADWGKPMYLRFAHEMNGNWYSWSPGVNGNTSADFIAAWRHVHDIFRQAGATNVRWVWSPNVMSQGVNSFVDMYPGDAYVDWVALGGYNWGPERAYHVWQSMADVFGNSYNVLTGMTSKPLMIAETSSAEGGGDKGAWITQGLLNEVPSRMPRVRAVIWFHENKEADWRVNSSSGALAAFREAAASTTYGGKLP